LLSSLSLTPFTARSARNNVTAFEEGIGITFPPFLILGASSFAYKREQEFKNFRIQIYKNILKMRKEIQTQRQPRQRTTACSLDLCDMDLDWDLCTPQPFSPDSSFDIPSLDGISCFQDSLHSLQDSYPSFDLDR
jgi:hypothetical protein